MIDSACRSPIADQARSASLKDMMISSTGFAFDPRSGLTYLVNTSGADIIRWLNEGLGSELVVERMRAEYDVDEHSARRDFESFLFSLRQHALL
jgi:Coenzyme PQQ synthesis protein D (PqqD)